MIDFIETVIVPIIALVTMACMVLGVVALISGPSKEQEMYKHCINDGIKDYVCYQMMHRPAEYVPMPMPIPMRTK